MSNYTKFESIENAKAKLLGEDTKTLFWANGLEIVMAKRGIEAIRWAVENDKATVEEIANAYRNERTYWFRNTLCVENPHVPNPSDTYKWLFPFGIYAKMGDSRLFFVGMDWYGTNCVIEPVTKKHKSLRDDALKATVNEIKSMSFYDSEKSIIENIINFALEGNKPETAPEVKVEEKKVDPMNSQNDFMTLLHQTFVATLGDNLVDEVMPVIKARIVETFGFIPERHEIVTATIKRELTGITHKKFELVCNLVANGLNPYLCGPAGTGKNVLAQQVAEALGLDFYTMNSVTDEYKFTGFVDANGRYIETEFYKAFTKGGLFFLDEMDASASEVLVMLNMAIANRMFPFPCGTKKAHDDFRVIAAGNTLGTGADASYVGRMQLDAATLNRFVTVHVGYDERIDLANAGGDTELVEFAKAYRKVAKKRGIQTVCSYRNIKTIAMMAQFATLEEALASALCKDMNRDDINIMAADSDMPNGNKYAMALKNVTPICEEM